MMRFLYIAAFAAMFAACLAEDPVVFNVEPDFIHAFTGGDRTTICGCGFSKFTAVTCRYNGQWSSTNAYIIDDGNIVCEAPVFPWWVARESLPQNWRLELIFDTGDVVYVGQLRVGPQPETAGQQISSQFGRTTGGGSLVISGSGFLDVWAQNPTVYFDKVGVNASSYTENTITVTIPAGKINQNARLSVMFYSTDGNGGWYKSYMFLDDSYRYGPYVTGINAECINPNGGDTITITGVNLDDTTGPGNQPLIVLSYASGNDDSMYIDNGYDGDFQISLIAQSSSATAVTFLAPNATKAILNNGVGSTSTAYRNAWGLYMSVDVYFDQTWANSVLETGFPLYGENFIGQDDFNGAETPQTVGFRYGGYIEQSYGPRIGPSGDRASTVAGSYAHLGGLDKACIRYCGASWFSWTGVNAAVWEFFYDGQSICTDDPVLNGNDFCCTTKTFADSSCNSGVPFTATLTTPNLAHFGNSYILSSTDESDLSNTWVDEVYNATEWDITVGPVQALDSVLHVVPHESGDLTTRTVQMHAANYHGSAGTSASDWTATTTTYSSTNADGTSVVHSPISNTFNHTDTQITFYVGGEFFDVTNEVDFHFNQAGGDGNCATDFVHWGPLCGPWFLNRDDNLDSEYENIDVDEDLGLSTKYVGLYSGSVTISGVGLNQNGAVHVVFCERNSDDGEIYSGMNAISGSTSRFNNNAVGGISDVADSCTSYQLGTATGLSNTSVTVSLPTNNNQILWGDQYDVYLYFEDVDDYTNYNADYATALDLDESGTNEYNGRILCGRVRVGCTADSTTCSSDFGPAIGYYQSNDANTNYLGLTGEDVPKAADVAAAYLEGNLGANGAVTITGQFMQPDTASVNVALVGYTATTPASTGTNSQTFHTHYNKDALVDAEVDVVCDVCNLTRPEDAALIVYGPAILSLDIGNGFVNSGSGTWDGQEGGDIWGAGYTAETDTSKDNYHLKITGVRFADYVKQGSSYDNDGYISTNCDGNQDYSNQKDCKYFEGDDVAITVFVDGVFAPLDRLVVYVDSSFQDLFVVLPARPFGTRAVVKVYFGLIENNVEFNNYYEEFSQDQSDYGRYLIAENVVYYTPKITNATVSGTDGSYDGARDGGDYFGYAASAHGLEEITIKGVGFLGEYSENLKGFLGNYQLSDCTADDSETVRCVTTRGGAKKRMEITTGEGDGYQIEDDYNFKFGAEFNTDVWLHLEVQDIDDEQYLPYESYSSSKQNINKVNYSESDSLNPYYGVVETDLSIHNRKILSDKKFHWGPVCDGLTSRNWGFTFSSGTNTIGGDFLQDCLAEGSVGNTDYVEVYDIGSTITTYCIARNVTISMEWLDKNGGSHTTVLRNNVDSLQSSTWTIDNDELSPEAIASSANLDVEDLPCDFSGTIKIVYDAVVTNSAQNTITCLNDYEINSLEITDVSIGSGGFANSELVEFGVDANETTTGDRIYFAWRGNSLDVTFDDLNNAGEYYGDAQCKLDGTNIATTESGSTVNCVLPQGNWQDEKELTIVFSNTGETNPEDFLTSCSYFVAIIHYGPALKYQDYCDGGEGAYDIECAANDLTIKAFGPRCCGLDSGSTAIFGAGVDNQAKSTWNFASSEWSMTVDVPGGSGCPTDLQLDNFRPLSTLGAIGVVFYNSTGVAEVGPFDYDTKNECDGDNKDTTNCLFTTYDNRVNSICYGPWFDTNTVDTRYTYGAQSDVDTESDLGGNHAQDLSQTFEGSVSLTSEFPDDNITISFCLTQSEGNCRTDLFKNDSSLSGADINFDLRAAMNDANVDNKFTVQCGEDFNHVEFGFRYGNNGFVPVRELFAEITTADSGSPRIVVQPTSNNPISKIILDHRPMLVNVEVTNAVPATGVDWEINYNTITMFNDDEASVIFAPEYGNLIVDVEVSNAFDFYQNSLGSRTSDDNFGKYGMVGLLGAQDQSDFFAHAYALDQTTTVKNGYTNDVDGNANQLANLDQDEIISTISQQTITSGHAHARFSLPPAPFKSAVFFHALYNPHMDGWTRATRSSKISFLWLPYLTGVSKPWFLPRGHESMIVFAEGLRRPLQYYDAGVYDDDVRPILSVSRNFATGPELYSQCRLVKDTQVMCQTPAFSGVGSVTPALHIRKAGSCDSFGCEDDVVKSTSSLDIIGLNGHVTPNSIASDGGTRVFFPFYGTEHFNVEDVYCGFTDYVGAGNVPYFPVELVDGGYECVIPDVADVQLDTISTNARLWVFRPSNPTYCGAANQPFLTYTSTDAVRIGFPCVTDITLPDYDDRSGQFVALNDFRHKIQSNSTEVIVYGDFFPTEPGFGDLQCNFTLTSCPGYFGLSDYVKDGTPRYRIESVVVDVEEIVQDGEGRVGYRCTLPQLRHSDDATRNSTDVEFDFSRLMAVQVRVSQGGVTASSLDNLVCMSAIVNSVASLLASMTLVLAALLALLL